MLKPCNLPRDGTAPPLPPPIKVNGKEKYEVKEILDSKTYCGKLQYLVKWLRYPNTDNQWVYKDQVAGASNLVKLFHWLYPAKLSKSKGPDLARKTTDES